MRFLLALFLLLDAYVGHETFLGTIGVSEQYAHAYALTIAGAIALVAVLVVLRPTRIPLVIARGVAVVSAAVILLVWVVGVAFSGIGGGSPDAAEMRRWHLFAAGTVALQVAIFIVAHRIARAPLGRTILDAALGTVAVHLGGLLLLGSVYIVAPFADFAITAPRFGADSAMTASVARVQACAWQFAARHPGAGFPRDLAAMGPPPAGTGCLDAKLSRGRTGRVQLAYRPAPPDATGRVRDFTVLAAAASGEHGEARQAFGDSAGFLRTGFAATRPDTLPIVGGNLRAFAAIRACAEVYRQRHPAEGYPAALTGFERLQPEVGERGAALLGCNPYTVPLRDASRFGGAERFTYTPTGSRPVADYVLELRPTSYGVHGIRSYRASARGPIHMTRDDRPARDADPVVADCAYDLGKYTCAPPTGGIAPQVTLEAPATAVRDMSFPVAIRDLRGAAADAPYQAWIVCDILAGKRPAPRPVSTDYSFTLAGNCTINGRDHPTWDTRVLLQAWVRDRAGSVVVLADTITLVPGL